MAHAHQYKPPAHLFMQFKDDKPPRSAGSQTLEDITGMQVVGARYRGGGGGALTKGSLDEFLASANASAAQRRQAYRAFGYTQ
jgi:hypothetical protein